MKKKRKTPMGEVICMLIMMVVVLLTLLPLIKVLVTSVSEWVPNGLTFHVEKLYLGKYELFLKSERTIQIMKNSLFVTVVGSVFGTVISVLGGYVLAQKELPGRGVLSAMVFGTILFHGGIVPTYLVVKNLGLLNTLWSVILTGTVNVMYIFYLKSIFEQVPQNFADAARVDGANERVVFWNIVLPTTKPAISMVFLMYVVQFWNEYANYRIYITKGALYNWQMAIKGYEESLDDLICGAGPFPSEVDLCVRIVLSMIPVLVFVFAFNKCFNQVLEPGREKK